MNQLKLSALALLFLAFFVDSIFAQAAFLMGEDVLHPSGLVLTVNEVARREFSGGLGARAKQDEVRINLTIVNTGFKTFQVEPLEEFSLELGRSFKQAADPEKRAADKAFSVFPSTQSRIDLYFKVPAEDKHEPILVFNLEDSEVKIYCSRELEQLAQKSASQSLSVEDAVTLARFYVDAGRYSSAQAILERALQSDPGNNQLLVLMATVHEANDDRHAAAECLDRINPSQITTFDEAVALARQGLNLGHYRLSIAVLEPYELINKLDAKNRVLLARAYYYEDDLVRAENILQQLASESCEDRVVYFTLGNIRDRQDRTGEAIELWEKAISIDSAYFEAYYNIGVGYYKQQKIDKAREYWQKVLTLNPDSEILRAVEDALTATAY